MTRRRETECETARSVVLVVGLGNPLRGDDGVGPRVVAELKRRSLPKGVEVLDAGAAGLDLLQLTEGWDRVVVVDAADVGKEPGQFVRFTHNQARLVEADEPFSFHHAGLAEVLALARALDRHLPPIVIFGVQPRKVGWGEGLSTDLESGLPILVDAVLEEVSEQ